MCVWALGVNSIWYLPCVTCRTYSAEFVLSQPVPYAHSSVSRQFAIGPRSASAYHYFNKLHFYIIPFYFSLFIARFHNQNSVCISRFRDSLTTSRIYGSQNRQRLFPYTASTDWFFITETECVYCAVRTGSLRIIQVNFRL